MLPDARASGLRGGDEVARPRAAGDADIGEAVLAHARVLAASERLAALAREHGFTDIRVARSAQPRDLIAAA
ncbi:MAG TPA: hypothetical protein VNS59_03520 [Lysobacter sp.]|nr:hypothetical protein [Lysobacter sp.]